MLRVLFVGSVFLLVGCPAKDWIKRDDAYLSVEQYKNMTEVIRINDSLYRVKKGEELNQNKITQLFVDFQYYKESSRKLKKRAFREAKAKYQADKTLFKTLFYVLLLLDSGKEQDAYSLLRTLKKITVTAEDKKLLHLVGLFEGVLKDNKRNRTMQTKLMNEKKVIMDKYELAMEEMRYLNKQVNELKSIEDSLHAREIEIELER